MGLLDALTSGSQGGYGGLLDSLLYQSPLLKPNDVQQPQYDPMGNYTGITPQAPNPFGPLPQMSQPSPGQFAPQSPFNSGAAPVAGLPPAQAPILPPPQNVAPAPQPPAPQDMPVGTMNIGGQGGYQMPQFGSAQDYAPTTTPANAQPAQGALPGAPQQQTLPSFMGGAQPGAGFGDRLNAGLQNFANSKGLLPALAGGITGLATGNRTDALGMQQQNLAAQFQATHAALVANGVPDAQARSTAMLSVMNPKAAETVLPELLTNKTELKMVKDALGAEHPYSWNSREQTLKPVGADGEGAGGGAGQGVSLLAPGVKEYNPSLSGDAYLAQFGPEVRASVKAYINGDVMPTGNPRTQAIAAKAKEIAQKYGQETGIPVSDALYSEKRKYRTELGTNSPNSAGGQAKAFNQGISHLGTLADTLEKLDNSNGLGIPAVAGVTNAIRQGVSNDQSAIADEAKSLGQTVAGEVGKLFSGSSGGGVHERELTRERFDTVKSKPQLAAALRATLETMNGGLQALEQRRDSILGPNSGVDLVSDATKQNITKIQGAIDRLEGKGGGNTTKTGVTWSVVK